MQDATVAGRDDRSTKVGPGHGRNSGQDYSQSDALVAPISSTGAAPAAVGALYLT
jgi:hypothetical protein